MERHDRDALGGVIVGHFHDKRDMLQECAEIWEFFHRADEFLEVFETTGAVGGPFLLPHIGVAGFLKHLFREFIVLHRVDACCPAGDVAGEITQGATWLGLQFIGFDETIDSFQHRNAGFAGILMHEFDGGIAKAALGGVHDALEGEVIGRIGDDPEIGEGIADFEALVKARAANDAIGQAESDEAVFDLAHLG